LKCGTRHPIESQARGPAAQRVRAARHVVTPPPRCHATAATTGGRGRRRCWVVDASSSGATTGPGRLDVESGARGDHRGLSGVDGGDDLGVVDPLEIDGGHAEVGLPQLALDDVERDPLVGEFDGMGVGGVGAGRTAAAHRPWRRRDAVGRGRRHSPKAGRGLARRPRIAARRPAAPSGARARDGGGPSPTGPCRPRAGGRPCRRGPVSLRDVGQGRARRQSAPR
jgi:hypothetical protein